MPLCLRNWYLHTPLLLNVDVSTTDREEELLDIVKAIQKVRLSKITSKACLAGNSLYYHDDITNNFDSTKSFKISLSSTFP